MGEGVKVKKGSPLPLGASLTPEGINLAVFSRHADSLTLVFFDVGSEKQSLEIVFDPAVNRTGQIWHMLVVGLDPTKVRYAFRADGAWDPEMGNRFDPKAYLIDPYAHAITGAEGWGDHYALVTYDGRPKTDSRLRCAIADNDFEWEGDHPPNVAMEDLVIYELHVRGFTKNPTSGVVHPGTFHGLTGKLPYLKRLGINAIELMPVQEFFESEIERLDPTTGARLVNYWGYSTTAFFAPKASYAASGAQGGQLREFKELVKACHREGIEVILDVVFNHTAEGDDRGPTLSFRGLDNRTYYILGPNGEYLNFSGCGNTLNCNHPVVREMIRDCLRYWVMETHVDGFRFDLASILGRDVKGEPLSSPPLIELIALDPILANVKLIAEAWDAAGLYQIGVFPAYGRWGEWNGKFRDTARKFLNGHDGVVPELATRLAGSADLYEAGGRFPYHSINYLTCHDGFTLYDLFAYNEKHNEANGENNRDGANDNYSYNHGIEGDPASPEIRALRRRQMKNAVVLLMVAQGVPMLYEADEMARSKKGNNNTYCQDNTLNWVDWSLLEKNADLFRFVAGMIALRKRFTTLGRRTYYTGAVYPGTEVRDITWYDTQGGEPEWEEMGRALAFMIGGPVTGTGAREQDLFVALNSEDKAVSVRLPKVKNRRWVMAVNTALKPPHDYRDPGQESELDTQKSIMLEPKSCVILIGEER